MNRKALTLIVLLGVFVFTTGISYAVFSKLAPSITVTPISGKITSQNGTLKFDDSLPKTEACPMNDVLYSKQQKSWWEKHRPLGVMIENHEDARPQSGLSSADIIYEAVAEGGITRFLAIFYCQDAGFVGPVRSARTYFLDLISEYGNYPLYVHVGGANCNEETGSGCANGAPADALGQIERYGWGRDNHGNDLNQFGVACPILCRYESRLAPQRATEHTMYATTQKLWDFAAKDRSLTNVDKKGVSWDTTFVPYTFQEETTLSGRGESQAIHLEFWEGYGQYSVDWNYDKTSNSYKRVNGGKPHIDFNTKKQLATKNIIVLYMRQSNANDGYDNNLHLLYKNKGTGKAVVFKNGERIDGTWSKKDRASRLFIFDTSGTPVIFNRGSLWFEILPTDGVLRS